MDLKTCNKSSSLEAMIDEPAVEVERRDGDAWDELWVVERVESVSLSSNAAAFRGSGNEVAKGWLESTTAATFWFWLSWWSP